MIRFFLAFCALPIMAQAQSPMTFLNNPDANRVLTFGIGYADREGGTRDSETLTGTTTWVNPVTDRLTMIYGLVGSDADIFDIATGTETENRSMGGQIGARYRLNPTFTTLSASVFYNSVDGDLTTGGVTTRTSDGNAGFALGVDQPIRLGSETWGSIGLYYSDIPAEDSATGTLVTSIAHRVTEDVTLFAGIDFAMSENSLTLSRDDVSQTVTLGTTYAISERVTLGANARTLLGEDEHALNLSISIAFPGN